MKKVLSNPDAANGGNSSQQTIQRLAADNAELEAEVAKYKSVEAQRAADEKIIAEKMAHGLSRHQAINVIRRQREFDEAAKPKSQSSKPKSKTN